MKTKLQFGIWLLTLGVGVSIALPAEAQNRPPKPQQERRQEQRQERRQERQPERRNDRNQGNPNRPPTTNQSVVPNTNRLPERARNQQNTNRRDRLRWSAATCFPVCFAIRASGALACIAVRASAPTADGPATNRADTSPPLVPARAARDSAWRLGGPRSNSSTARDWPQPAAALRSFLPCRRRR